MFIKTALIFMVSLFGSLSAASQAVIFDWGNVLATPLDRTVVVNYICNSFNLSPGEFEEVNLQKRKAIQRGKTEYEFWIQFAKESEVVLPEDWPQSYREVLKASLGMDQAMYALVDELKGKQIPVGLLSNINDRYTKLIREFGLYEPFDPCILSYEVGLEKPDPQIYQLLLKAVPFAPADIIFIDDKLENVEAAKTHGIDAFVFESHDQVRAELKKRGIL